MVGYIWFSSEKQNQKSRDFSLALIPSLSGFNVVHNFVQPLLLSFWFESHVKVAYIRNYVPNSDVLFF